MSKPEYDTSPAGIARDLYALASLIEFFIACEDEGRPLRADEVQAALDPFQLEEDSPEAACLQGLPAPVRETIAQGLEVGLRELEPVLAGREGGAADRPKAVQDAQGKIRGSLRIVRKLGGGTLPGWIQEIWDIHVRE